MKERPILFSAPMVRALLDGSKTQTRRVVKDLPPWPITEFHLDGGGTEFNVGSRGTGKWLPNGPAPSGRGMASGHWRLCPYGQPGDRLWVRETWGVVSSDWDAAGNLVDWTPDRPATAVNEMRFGQGYYSGHAIYAADGSYEWAGDDDGGGEPRFAWHPSIHMPRAASRILLEVVSVRVERLQDISEADAKAEGIEPHEVSQFMIQGTSAAERAAIYRDAAVGPYCGLWQQINGAASWDANPWVWVVEFKRVAQ